MGYINISRVAGKLRESLVRSGAKFAESLRVPQTDVTSRHTQEKQGYVEVEIDINRGQTTYAIKLFAAIGDFVYRDFRRFQDDNPHVKTEHDIMTSMVLVESLTRDTVWQMTVQAYAGVGIAPDVVARAEFPIDVDPKKIVASVMGKIRAYDRKYMAEDRAEDVVSRRTSVKRVAKLERAIFPQSIAMKLKRSGSGWSHIGKDVWEYENPIDGSGMEARAFVDPQANEFVVEIIDWAPSGTESRPRYENIGQFQRTIQWTSKHSRVSTIEEDIRIAKRLVRRSSRIASKTMTVGHWIDYLAGWLTQYDADEQQKAAKNPRRYHNPYALPQYMGSVQAIRREVSKYINLDTEDALAALKESIEDHFIASKMPPVRKLLKALDAYQGSGRVPSYKMSRRKVAWGGPASAEEMRDVLDYGGRKLHDMLDPAEDVDFINVFLTPVYGPENYYMDGEVSGAQAFRSWDARLKRFSRPEVYAEARKTNLYRQLKRGR